MSRESLTKSRTLSTSAAPPEPPTRDLATEVRTFATNISAVLLGTLPHIDPEPLRILLDSQDRHITLRQLDPQGLPLFVGDDCVLRLKIAYRCAWNKHREFLAVDECNYTVLPSSLTEPIFRYHYRRNSGGGLPTAHLHVHGHRDEALALMLGGRDRGRVKERLRGLQSGKFPRLSRLHFPLGGPRFRPGLEDVLEMLRVEFEIEALDTASTALSEGRAVYRQMQLATAIGDDPLTAAAELERLGFTIALPADYVYSARIPLF